MKLFSTVKLSTYSCQFTIMVTDELIQQVNAVYKKHKLNAEFDIPAEGVMVSPTMSHYYIIIDEDCLSHNTIAHEAFHTVNRIMTDRDIHDEESGAWLSGHIASVIYKFLDKKKLQIKHG
jgi:hypothetical protein